ncbi:2'-5' RNA ligase family protein [Streptomyces sp. NPDC056296]|uniref:2'-5' RNA ligase family protein n=1 Tax=Streptomyces sp. NPDC056296 TaxID=3345775 RepID=UPI0035DF78AB
MSWPHIPLSADPATFPARPPTDLTDPAVIAAHDQAAFDAVESMVDHWDRPGWTARTRASPGRLDDVISAATPRLPAAFRLRAVPLAGSRGAVRLSVAPWIPVPALHAALGEAMTPPGLPPRKPTALFRPHLSLAYNNRSRPAAPVFEAVTALRDLPPVDLPVQEVRLVELRREGRCYRWDVVKSLSLADRRWPERQDGNDRLADGGDLHVPPPCQCLPVPVRATAHGRTRPAGSAAASGTRTPPAIESRDKNNAGHAQRSARRAGSPLRPAPWCGRHGG